VNLFLFDVLDVARRTAAACGDLRLQLKREGRPIPANEAWIAALGLEHALPVLSRDAHFGVVRGLKRLGWSPDGTTCPVELMHQGSIGGDDGPRKGPGLILRLGLGRVRLA
jgi:hypothetical protein